MSVIDRWLQYATSHSVSPRPPPPSPCHPAAIVRSALCSPSVQILYRMHGKFSARNCHWYRNYTRAHHVLLFFSFLYHPGMNVRSPAATPHLKYRTVIKERTFHLAYVFFSLFTHHWQSELTHDLSSSQPALRSQTPGQLLSMSPAPGEGSKTGGSRWSLSATRGIRRLRSCPPSVQLLVGPSTVWAPVIWFLQRQPCSQAKQSIDPACPVSRGWWCSVASLWGSFTQGWVTVI